MKKVMLFGLVVILSSFHLLTIAEDKPVQNDDVNMSVITIGTGLPKGTDDKAKSSTAIKFGNEYFIVDCGDGSFANLQQDNFSFDQVRGIFLTHHHLDHTTDFFDLFGASVLSSDKKVNVIGPPRTELFVEFYNDVYLDDLLYRKLNTTKNEHQIDKTALKEHAVVKEVIGSEIFYIDGVKITTAEMTHTMYDLAYRFDLNDQSIVVSGDTSFDEDLISLAKDADILVIDGTLYKPNNEGAVIKSYKTEPYYEYGGNFNVAPHLTFEDMIQIASEANIKKLIVTHYGDAVDNRISNSIKKGREIFDGEIIYGTDMLEVAVNDVELSYPIVDTNQKQTYSDTAVIELPTQGERFYGQDGNYNGNQPSYKNNGDGTITDEVTQLMWLEDMGKKMTYDDAVEYAENLVFAGYSDWRIPTIKELYSLIQFNGQVMGGEATNKLFIDTDYFIQPLGDTSVGERDIDAQTWSSTFYTGKTMNSDETIFGVNFIDGRIKGYPVYDRKKGEDKTMYFRLVRGSTQYGLNNFVDNQNGTITDLATGLTWQQHDSGEGLDWEDALAYAENLELGGYSDWRLPNAKELQSIVDYNRSLQSDNEPSINPIFNVTQVKSPTGQVDYPYYWTGTTHLDGQNPYDAAVYIAFGEALGKMNNNIIDVHGAGAQRSDPKSGHMNQYPSYFGPQGDMRIVFNYVRCVRD